MWNPGDYCTRILDRIRNLLLILAADTIFSPPSKESVLLTAARCAEVQQGEPLCYQSITVGSGERTGWQEAEWGIERGDDEPSMHKSKVVDE